MVSASRRASHSTSGEADSLEKADAEALIRDYGDDAYGEARGRERAGLPDGTTHPGRPPAHWRRVALIVASMTGKRVGLDSAGLEY
jgi:hypothetical protein